MSGIMKKWLIFVLLLFVLQIWAVADNGNKDTISWPALPKKGFVTGRAATYEDVEQGKAAFYFKLEGKISGVPLDIAIPQYAIHINNDTGERTQGIIIQAENFGDIAMIAMRRIDNWDLVMGSMDDFQLLGTKTPRQGF